MSVDFHGFTSIHKSTEKRSFYQRWDNLLRRCQNPKHSSYKNYGGRGIICQWKSFDDFRKDMYASFLRFSKKHGLKNTTIERVDNDGDYSKENCQWATYETQCLNRRDTKLHTNGKITDTLSGWARRLGRSHSTLYERLQNHPPNVALSPTFSRLKYPIDSEGK